MGDINYSPLIEDMTFSYSRINSYKSCPYAWFLNYIDKMKKRDLFYSSYGNLMHDIIAKYYKGEITKSEMPVEFLTRFSTDVKGVRPSASIVEKYVDSSLEYLRNFEEFGLNTVAVEEKVNFQIDGIPMIGFIDYIGEKDGDYIIVDHKSHSLKPRSGRKKPTVKDKELDEYLRQLYLYSTAVKDRYGKFPKELWFNCYRSGIVIKEPFDEEKYNEAVEWATSTIEEIKGDADFYDNYDYFYCRWICDQALNCEVFWEEVMGE